MCIHCGGDIAELTAKVSAKYTQFLARPHSGQLTRHNKLSFPPVSSKYKTFLSVEKCVQLTIGAAQSSDSV